MLHTGVIDISMRLSALILIETFIGAEVVADDDGGTSRNVSRAEILEAVDKISASQGFASAQQLQNFIQYVVTETLEGRCDDLKAYSIAVDALGRQLTFDAQQDPFVRVTAVRLRKALSVYYATDGIDDPIVIGLPKGSYIPTFERRQVDELAAPERGESSRRLQIRDWNLPPSVVVNPFEIVGSSTGAEVLARRVSDLLISSLSYFKTLRVSPNPGGREPKNYDYLISGTVTKSAGSTVEIDIGLTNVAGRRVWSRLLSSEDGTVEQVLRRARLDLESVAAELASPGGTLHAFELAGLQAQTDHADLAQNNCFACVTLFHAFDQTKDITYERQAERCLAAAIKRGGATSQILSASALLEFLQWSRNEGSSKTAVPNSIFVKLENAIMLDPTDSLGHEVKGYLLMSMGRHEEASIELDKARTVNPILPRLHVLSGWNQVMIDNWAEGVELVNTGIRLSVAPPGWYKIIAAADAYRRDDFVETTMIAKDIIRMGDSIGYIFAMATAAEVGELEDAREYKDLYARKVTATALDPVLELERKFNKPEILARLRAAISRIK